MSAARPPERRKADAVEKLEAPHADLWLSSASAEGTAHLVPLSYAWDGTCVILACEDGAITTRNVLVTGSARLALGTTRDVVMIDSTLESVVAVADAPPAVAQAYADQADWDPRQARGDFVYLRLRPRRIQVWREADEIAGRTVMRDGAWTT